jgi:hypothetical protein
VGRLKQIMAAYQWLPAVRRAVKECLWFIVTGLAVSRVIIIGGILTCPNYRDVSCQPKRPGLVGPILTVYVAILTIRITIWVIRTVRQKTADQLRS